jgi:hypothetical protein
LYGLLEWMWVGLYPAFDLFRVGSVAAFFASVIGLSAKGYVGFKIGVKVWLPYWPDWAWKWSYKHKGD